MSESTSPDHITSDFPIDEILEIQSAILTGKQSIIETVGNILKHVLKFCETDFGQILLLDGGNLVVIASTSKDDIGRSLPVDASVSGMATIRKESVRFGNLADESKYQLFLEPTMQSEMVIPLKIAERLIGVLNFESLNKNAFTQRQENILAAFSGLIAMAFLIDEENELKKRANEADKMLSAGQIVHRLTGRAGAIRGWIEIMREIVQNEKPDLGKDDTLVIAMDDIELKAQNILELVNELKKRTSEPETLVDIPNLIAETIKIAQIPEKIDLKLSIAPDLPEIRSDPVIREVFLNIITNAVEAMPQGGKLTLVARNVNDGNNIVIEFNDTGVGIPESLHTVVFESNFTTKSSGHGLGLWWSRAFIRAIGGEIKLESKEGRGAKFTITLPVQK